MKIIFFVSLIIFISSCTLLNNSDEDIIKTENIKDSVSTKNLEVQLLVYPKEEAIKDRTIKNVNLRFANKDDEQIDGQYRFADSTGETDGGNEWTSFSVDGDDRVVESLLRDVQYSENQKSVNYLVDVIFSQDLTSLSKNEFCFKPKLGPIEKESSCRNDGYKLTMDNTVIQNVQVDLIDSDSDNLVDSSIVSFEYSDQCIITPSDYSKNPSIDLKFRF